MSFNEIPVRTAVRCFSNIEPTHDMNKDKRLICVRMIGRMQGYVCDVDHNPLETVNQPSTQF